MNGEVGEEGEGGGSKEEESQLATSIFQEKFKAIFQEKFEFNF